MIQEKYGGYELSSYEPISVTLPSFMVSEQETIEEMERIASRHSSRITVNPHPVRADDIVLVNILTSEGANPFPGLTHHGASVQLGVGSLPEEVEVALLGHQVGDVIEVDFMYTDYSQVASDRESPVDGGCGIGETGEPEQIDLVARVEVLAIQKFVTPEISNEWVAKNIALANTVQEFRENTANKLYKERRREFTKTIECLVMSEVGKRLVGNPPADIVDNVAKQMTREFDKFVEQYDMDITAYMAIQGLDDVAFAAQINCDARDRVVQDIALASWATHYDIKLNDDDINFMFGEPTPERTYEARVEAEQSGQIETFKDLALRAKVAEQLTRSATFLSPEGIEDEGFKRDIDRKHQKQQMVRAHATSDPMLQPPMVAR